MIYLGMNSLSDGREAADFGFLLKMLEDTLSVIELRCHPISDNANPYDPRHRKPLSVLTHSTYYGANEPVTRILRTFNGNQTI